MLVHEVNYKVLLFPNGKKERVLVNQATPNLPFTFVSIVFTLSGQPRPSSFTDCLLRTPVFQRFWFLPLKPCRTRGGAMLVRPRQPPPGVWPPGQAPAVVGAGPLRLPTCHALLSTCLPLPRRSDLPGVPSLWQFSRFLWLLPTLVCKVAAPAFPDAMPSDFPFTSLWAVSGSPLLVLFFLPPLTCFWALPPRCLLLQIWLGYSSLGYTCMSQALAGCVHPRASDPLHVPLGATGTLTSSCPKQILFFLKAVLTVSFS